MTQPRHSIQGTALPFRWLASRSLAVALAALAGAPPVCAEAEDTAAVQAAPATANLNINPKRLTFDRLGKSAAIYVFNQSGGRQVSDGQGSGATFDVSLVDRVMLPSGEIMPAAEAASRADLAPLLARLKSARELLLVTPRRATMVGNTGQTIRVRAASSAAVPPGEYRTHLTVTALPPADAGLTAEKAIGRRENRMTFSVNTVIGLAIPVIIRVGPVDMRAGIQNMRIAMEHNPAIKDNSLAIPMLYLDLLRIGVNSIFGDLVIRGAQEHGDKEPLGAVRGIAVYPEIDRRFVKLALRRTPAPGEQIEIVFNDDDVNPGKQLVRVTLAAP